MTPDGNGLHPALVAAIEQDRESLNHRFRLAALRTRIDPQAFCEHLVQRVNPIVAAVHAVFPERVRIVTGELYNVSLDLFGASLLGAETEFPMLDRIWRELLPGMPQLVARDPLRVVGSLCNASLQICRQTASGGERWLTKLATLAPRCTSPQQLLDTGKVLSWTCGLAQYRGAALQLARQLDHEILVGIFEVADATDADQMAGLLDQWERNPWKTSVEDPQAPTARAVSQVAMVGDFRGYGGVFLEPPTVVAWERALFVQDAHSMWQMYADRFGCHFHRVGESHGAPPASKDMHREAVSLAKDGTVSWHQRSFHFRHLAGAASVAFDGVTLAVTIPNSFHVWLLAEQN